MTFSPDITAFCCHHSAYHAADGASQTGTPCPENITLIRLPCMGRLNELHILKAFENGADGVLVLTCPEGSCHHISGSTRASGRVRSAGIILNELGIGSKRVQVLGISANMAPKFAQAANKMSEKLRELGPSPMKRKRTPLQEG